MQSKVGREDGLLESTELGAGKSCEGDGAVHERLEEVTTQKSAVGDDMPRGGIEDGGHVCGCKVC